MNFLPYFIYWLSSSVLSEALVEETLIKQKWSDEPTHNKELVQLDPTHDMRKSVQIDKSHDRRKPVLVDLNHNMRNPIEVDPTHNKRKPVQAHQTHDMRYPVHVYPTHSMRKPVQVAPTHDIRKPVQVDPAHDMRKPVQVDPTHNMRKPVQVDPTHDMRKPVQVDPTHDMRKPVQVDPTHNMRKPVQVDPTHDMREPVQVDPTHNLRKPVKLMETHNLRWPVAEFHHGIQNPIPEIDIFRSADIEEKLKKTILDFLKVGSKSSFASDHDPIYEALHQDEILKSKCTPDSMSQDVSKSNTGTNSGHKEKRKNSEYKKLFHDSVRACGIPFNKSTERQERKSTKWPWMVSLQEYIFHRFLHTCAGSLINNLWVITAAHCVESRPKWDFLLQLSFEENEDSRRHIERFVEMISSHPKFNNLNFDHDIALLRMDTPIVFQPDIVPICLPWITDEIENRKGVVLGWRLATERTVEHGFSHEKTVPVLTNKECEVMFLENGSTENIQESFICASFQHQEKHLSCIGDSGGPLAVLDDKGRWLLAGLYSWGKSCSIPNQPEVYIRISRYAEWIEDTIVCYESNMKLHEME